jgi:hypothetical protein
MDLAPTTWLMSLQRQLQVFFYRHQPYSEGEFEKPFGEVPENPMQLRYAAAALEWLHNNTSDSQESQHIHWAVWHIASSAVFGARLQLRMPQWIMQYYYIDIWIWRDPSMPANELCTLTSVQLRFDEGKRHRELSLHLNKNSSSSWNKLVAGVDGLLDQHHLHTNPSSIMSSTLSDEYSIDELLWLVGIISQLWLSGSLERHKP